MNEKKNQNQFLTRNKKKTHFFNPNQKKYQKKKKKYLLRKKKWKEQQLKKLPLLKKNPLFRRFCRLTRRKFFLKNFPIKYKIQLWKTKKLRHLKKFSQYSSVKTNNRWKSLRRTIRKQKKKCNLIKKRKQRGFFKKLYLFRRRRFRAKSVIKKPFRRRKKWLRKKKKIKRVQKRFFRITNLRYSIKHNKSYRKLFQPSFVNLRRRLQ